MNTHTQLVDLISESMAKTGILEGLYVKESPTSKNALIWGPLIIEDDRPSLLLIPEDRDWAALGKRKEKPFGYKRIPLLSSCIGKKRSLIFSY